MLQSSVTTADGGFLRVYSFGEGPGVVLVGGTNTAGLAYAKFARKLARAVPVHVYDRRGRGGSSPQPADYSLETEISDLRTVLATTDSTMILGHSFGGMLALEAGLRLPVSRIAVYDAVPNIDGVVPTAFLPELEAAVGRGDTVGAVTILGKGLSAKLRETRVPDQAFRLLVRFAGIATRKGRAWHGTVASAVPEIAWLRANQAAASHFAGITAPVLLLFGERSDPFYRTVAEGVGAVLPDGRVAMAAGSDHGAMDRPAQALLEPLAEFLGAGRTSARLP
jgi:pimeloyl-ACP methyl ester carboxylesterase